MFCWSSSIASSIGVLDIFGAISKLQVLEAISSLKHKKFRLLQKWGYNKVLCVLNYKILFQVRLC
eukprot:m.35907 g.35907  ORF g.35907 m.35907 type:complete len:65 (-) comp8983_c0_seq1:123-317(-)